MGAEHWRFQVPLRLRSLFLWAQPDQELHDELRDHVERKTEGYVAVFAGGTQPDMRFQSLVAFDPPSQNPLASFITPRQSRDIFMV